MEINSEQDVKDYPIFHLKDLLCPLSINLHSGMELVHFEEFTGLGQKEHGVKELPVGLLHHHSGFEVALEKKAVLELDLSHVF